jgi:hypothetical protein
MPLPRFQFRLRTLLLVVALLGVACWVVKDRLRLIHERDEALRWAEENRTAAEKNYQAAVDATARADRAEWSAASERAAAEQEKAVLSERPRK